MRDSFFSSVRCHRRQFCEGEEKEVLHIFLSIFSLRISNSDCRSRTPPRVNKSARGAPKQKITSFQRERPGRWSKTMASRGFVVSGTTASSTSSAAALMPQQRRQAAAPKVRLRFEISYPGLRLAQASSFLARGRKDQLRSRSRDASTRKEWRRRPSMSAAGRFSLTFFLLSLLLLLLKPNNTGHFLSPRSAQSEHSPRWSQVRLIKGNQEELRRKQRGGSSDSRNKKKLGGFSSLFDL